MERKYIALIAVVLLAALAGCASADTQYSQQSETIEERDVVDSTVLKGEGYRDGIMRRYIDEEANVVCYEKSMPSGTGIDCMPLEETRL